MELKDIRVNDLSKILDITNEYIDKFISAVNPREYEDNQELFVQTCITGPSIIASEIIDKIAVTFHIDRRKVLEQFSKKLELALRWVDHKNDKKGQ